MAIRVHYVLLVLCALEASFWIVSGADSVRVAEIEPHMAHRLDNTKAIHQPDSNSTEAAPTATEEAVPEFPKVEAPPQIPSAASQKSGNDQHHSPQQSLPQDGIPSQTPQEDGFNQVFNQIKSGLAGPLHLLCGFICVLSLLGILPDHPGTYRRWLAPVLLAAGAVVGRKTLWMMLTAIVNGDQAAVDAVVLFLNPLALELKYWIALLPVHFLSKLGLDESVDLVFRRVPLCFLLYDCLSSVRTLSRMFWFDSARFRAANVRHTAALRIGHLISLSRAYSLAIVL